MGLLEALAKLGVLAVGVTLAFDLHKRYQPEYLAKAAELEWYGADGWKPLAWVLIHAWSANALMAAFWIAVFI